MDLPAKLTERPNWILWRNEDGRKIPYQFNGLKAKSNDPATWVSFSAASAAMNGTYSGLGFVFDGRGVFGIDLDGCLDAAGQMRPWAQAILNQFPTYAEISPSGSGVKLFGLGQFTGTGRKKLIDAEACCDRKPGIEVYGQGRYFTVTGQKLPRHPCELFDCQAGLDALLASFQPAAEPAAAAVYLPPPANDLTARIRAYLNLVEPAVSGQRGHDTTFRAACTLVCRFNLRPEAAYPLLAEWNERCQPPWSEKDLRRKLAEADKQPGPRGDLLDERIAATGVELGPLLASLNRPSGLVIEAVAADEEPPDDIPDDPHALPINPAMIPGMIGDIVRHNLKTAIYPQPEIALGAAIALVATITGRKVEDTQGTRSNVYVLGLAPSGSGKEHARKLNKEILLRAGVPKMLGPERIGSSAGLARAVRDQPAILFQLDEISRLLETTKSSKAAHLWNVPSVLLQLFGSSNCLWIGDAYAKAEQTPVINQPHCVIYGTSVPGPFWAAMTHENVTDGLLGRFLPFESDYVDMQNVTSEEVPQAIIDRVRWWTAMNPSGGNLTSENPTPLVLRHTEAARERFLGHATDITRRRKREDPARAAMWSRTMGNTAKLSLIFACSEGVGGIELEHVNAAIRISNWATRRMLRMVFEYVSQNDYERESKQILRLVARPMTQNQLTRKTQHLKIRERDDIIRGLLQSGLVEIIEEKTAGRSRKIIRQKAGWTNALTKVDGSEI